MGASLLLALAACGSAGVQVQDIASDPSGTAPPQNVLAPEVDAANAGSIDAAFSSTDVADHELFAGDWSTAAFTEPIAFRLAEPGRVVFQANGFLLIETGPSGSPDGVIAVIEAVAFNTPDGPVPLGSNPLGTEFPDATVTDRGLINSQGRLMSWVDLRIESALLPESSQLDCGPAGEVPCTQLLVTESEGDIPLAPLDQEIRYVGQDFGSRRLYVAGVANEPQHVQNLGDLATELAISLVPAEGEFPGRRRITTLTQRGAPVPAGTWFAEVAGNVVEVRSETDLEQVTFDSWQPDLLVFNTTEPDPNAGFFVFEFTGFIAEVDMRTPTRDAPLSEDEFFDGLNQAIEVSTLEDSLIAGQESTSWEFGPLDADSPLACNPVERDDLSPDELCTNWGANGVRHVEFTTESVVHGRHYIPDLGVIVAWSYTDAGVGNPFSSIINALTLNDES